jgi:putative membrane protein
MSLLRRIIAHIVANGIALYFVGVVVRAILKDSDFIINGGWKGYLIAAILFGFLNSIIKPILKLVSLPFVFITAGLFIFIINMFLVWFGKYALDVLQFQGVSIVVVGGVLTYIAAGFLMALFNMVIGWLLKK